MANNIYELDFTGVQSTNYIPEGVHTVKVSGAEFKKASTGSDQLQVTFEAADGSIRSAWYSLLPQALWKLKGFLEVIGIPCDGKIKLNTSVIKGKTCSITVEPDPNDESKLIVTRTSKIASATTPAVAYQAAPAPQMPVQTAPPVAPVAPQPAVPPVQQAAQPVPNNLPPWMTQAAPAQPSTTAAPSNLPPWMTQK